MAKKNVSVKESVVEAELVRQVEALGGKCEKVQVIGKRGFFDRLVVLPGRVIFVELKRPRGGSWAEHQRRYAADFEALGMEVALVREMAQIGPLLTNKKGRGDCSPRPLRRSRPAKRGT